MATEQVPREGAGGKGVLERLTTVGGGGYPPPPPLKVEPAVVHHKLPFSGDLLGHDEAGGGPLGVAGFQPTGR